MCGIAGIISLHSSDPSLEYRIGLMCEAMYHRGPDGFGQHVTSRVALGHRRLSIIDLEAGAQPLCNETADVWTVFNGEIYNHVGLRKHLESSGHRMGSHADTEVLVHGYEEFGDDVVARLDGMFAFAILDERSDRILIVRDRLGIKPLYYFVSDDHLVFASEIKGILASGFVGREVDESAVSRFLTIGYGPGSETPIRGVAKLGPGEMLIVEGGGIDHRRYWRLDYSPPKFSGSFSDAVQATSRVLSHSVESHLMSDVPLGVLLSGGLDSTAILAIASGLTRDRIQCFTVGFEDPSIPDERPYAAAAAAAFDADLHQISIRPDEFFAFLPRYVHWMEELVCEPPAISLFMVSRLASEHVKVVLSGEGSDECFAGYRNYRQALALDRARRSLPKVVARMLSLGMRYSGSPRLTRAGRQLTLPLRDWYYGRTIGDAHGLLGPASSSILRPEVRAQIDPDFAVSPFVRLWNEASGFTELDAMQYVDSCSWLPDDLLVKADKMTMANSIELRVPFLDHHVVEFAASLPERYRLHRGTTKAPLREAMRSLLPKTILDRRKAGFPIPYSSWFRGRLQDALRQLLLDPESRSRRLLETTAVEAMLDRHRERGDRAKQIFCAAILEFWLREFDCR